MASKELTKGYLFRERLATIALRLGSRTCLKLFFELGKLVKEASKQCAWQEADSHA